MKKISFIIILAIFILLLFPTFFQNKSVPNNLIESTVGITAFDSNGEIYSGTCFPIGISENKTYFASCSHVVDRGSDKIIVTYGNSIFTAKKICSDRKNDIAIVSIDIDIDCKPLSISEVGLGSRVYASGFPENCDSLSSLYNENSKVVTTGNVISVIGIFEDPNSIICNVPCGEGMSGGPVVNENGEVAGIITVGYNDYEGVMGAACGYDLIQLCEKYNIPYTHKVSFRLIRDGVVLVLFMIILWMLIFEFLKRRTFKAQCK